MEIYEVNWKNVIYECKLKRIMLIYQDVGRENTTKLTDYLVFDE